MKYKKFIIENYKGITKPIEINVDNNSLVPIIGVNECGKTTFLNSIFAFDYINDDENKSFKHLTDVANLYDASPSACKLSAVVEISKQELKEYIKKIDPKEKGISQKLTQFPNDKAFEIKIVRHLKWENNSLSTSYTIGQSLRFSTTIVNKLCKEIIKNLPYILYFDDFRETFPDEIEINSEKKENKWLEILEELFKKTNKNFSVHDLQSIEERRRKSIISQVKKKLNETLTLQWSNFKLDNKDYLEIDIDFRSLKEKIEIDVPVTSASGLNSTRKEIKEVEKYYLKFDIIERDANGNEHYFYVRDRSKGFYWFFNFVMKLEFNPDIAGDHDNTIYLLDEPGSYLHPYAQAKLCKKLKELSENNIVIYCTHSHYLLNPEVIPLNKIKVISKTTAGSISLESFYNTKRNTDQTFQTAFQAIYDEAVSKGAAFFIANSHLLNNY